MPITISGNGGISGLGNIDGHDLETATLVVSGDTTIAPQAVGRATLFIEESTNTVGINTTTPAAAVFLEVADGTDPIVSLNNTGNGEVRLGCTAAGGYIGTESNHPFNIETNSSTKVTVLANGNVGIGTTNPESWLHLQDSTNTQIDFLKFQTIYGSPSGNKSILWRDFTDTVARISTDYTSPFMKMRFGSLYSNGYTTNDTLVIRNDSVIVGGEDSPAGTEQFYVSNGTVRFNVGSKNTSQSVAVFSTNDSVSPLNSNNLIIAQDANNDWSFLPVEQGVAIRDIRFDRCSLKFDNGEGIDFSASQGASASSSLLDDYEEGTWTPAIQFGLGSVGQTFIIAPGGIYTKIGNQVTVRFGFRINNLGTSTGTIQIAGLPYAGTSTSYNHPSGGLVCLDPASENVNKPFQSFVSGVTIQLRFGLNNTVPDKTAIVSGTAMFGSITYTI